MSNRVVVLVLLVVASFLAGCTGSGGEQAAPAETITATVTATATATVTATMTASADPPESTEPDHGEFPDGFPKKVRVADIPEPVDSAFEGFEFAVQVAPGVWTKLTPAATVMDAARGGGFSGYCASIEALEREYGHSRGGSCW